MASNSQALFWSSSCSVEFVSWSFKVPWIASRERACVKDLWLDPELALSSLTVCPWNKRLQQSRQFQWKCVRRVQASLLLTPQHCTERFGSPAFLKCISQPVFRVFGLDFAAGSSAAKPSSSLRLPLSETPMFLCRLSCCHVGSTPTTTWWSFHLQTPHEYWICSRCALMHWQSLLLQVNQMSGFSWERVSYLFVVFEKKTYCSRLHVALIPVCFRVICFVWLSLRN